VRCAQCGTDVYWTRISGTSECAMPPMGVLPFVTVAIVQRYDIATAQTRVVKPVGSLVRPLKEHVEPRNEEERIGQWLWGKLIEAIGVLFRWQLGLLEENGAGLPELPDCWKDV